MRHFIPLTVILLLFFSFTVKAQHRTKISGTLSDTVVRKPVEFAAIALLSQRDSSIVTSGITDFNGHFELKSVPKGRYIIKASHMSYEVLSKSIVVKGDVATTDIGSIPMKSKNMNLEEVVVHGKSTPVRVAKDTVEFNLAAYKPRANDVVEDVLKKLPGVVIDKDGGITVNGKSVTQVMVDGKRFFLNDPTLATQNLPADIIDRIQLVDKKSDQAEFTKVDDGASEKVINLTLKKDKKKGFFGSVRAGAGTDDRYDFGLRAGGFQGSTQLFTTGSYNNINRGGRGGGADFPNANRQGLNTAGNGAVNLNTEPLKDLSVNGSYRFNYGNSITENVSNRQNYEAEGSYLSDSRSSTNNFSRSHNFYSRMEYKYDTTLSMIFTPSLQFSNGDSYSSGASRQLGFDGALVNTEKSNNSSETESSRYGFDLLVRKQLPKPRQTFSMSINTSIQDNSSDGYTKQENFYAKLDSTATRNQNVLSDGKNNSVNVRASYTNPISKYFSGEAVYKFGYRYSSNENRAFDLNTATGLYDKLNDIYSRNNEVERYNNAIGATLNFAKEKFTANAGAEINITNMDYINQRGANVVDTSVVYNNISPMVNLSFTPSESSDFRLGFRANTRQPSIDQIRPLQNPNTPNSIYIGNSDLKQELQYALDFGYNYFNKKSFLSFNSYTTFSTTQDAIVNQTKRDDLGRNYYKAVNVSGLYNLGNFISLGKSVLNNTLHLGLSSNISYVHSPGFVNDVKYFTNQLQVGEGFKNYLTLSFLEIGAEIGWSYNKVTYEGLDEASSSAKKSSEYSTLSLNGSATAFLPAGFDVKSTIDVSKKYGDLASSNSNSLLWNASINKKFLKDKSLILGIMAFDILNKYRPFNRSVTSNYVEESTFKTISQTFMVTLSYNINRFGGMSVGGRRGGGPDRGPRNMMPM